jgi:hypothetical protein
MVLVGVGLPIGGFVMHGNQKKLDAEGKTVRAEIVGGESRSGRRGSKSYEVELRYTTDSGQAVNKQFTADKDTFEKAAAQGVGGALQVTCLPSEPKTARIVGDRNNAHVALMVIGLVVSLIGGVALIRGK